MTVIELLHKVVWGETVISFDGESIRHRHTHMCPIDLAGGNWQKEDGGLNFTLEGNKRIVYAADISLWRLMELRDKLCIPAAVRASLAIPIRLAMRLRMLGIEDPREEYR